MFCLKSIDYRNVSSVGLPTIVGLSTSDLGQITLSIERKTGAQDTTVSRVFWAIAQAHLRAMPPNPHFSFKHNSPGSGAFRPKRIVGAFRPSRGGAKPRDGKTRPVVYRETDAHFSSHTKRRGLKPTPLFLRSNARRAFTRHKARRPLGGFQGAVRQTHRTWVSALQNLAFPDAFHTPETKTPPRDTERRFSYKALSSHAL